jgi:hypothetical protein
MFPLQKVFSARLKAVYCINMHPISIKIMELAKKIMKPKLAARVSYVTLSSISIRIWFFRFIYCQMPKN